VHLGHLLMADEVLARLGYQQIRFIPTRVPPHKQAAPTANARQRVEMLRIATGDRNDFVVDTFEVDTEGVSYTVRTLRHLIEGGFITGRPGLIIGEDLVEGFDSWREADEIVELADIILVRRPIGATRAFSRPHRTVENLQVDISSTDVRERARSGLPFRYLVPPGVFEYLERHRPYRDTSRG
jgi:nicotinate-nucleotide adenylyltransferase